MSVTTVRLQAEVEHQLEAIASRLQRSKGWVINQALAEYIDKQQLEQERWQQTLDAMESAAKGKVVDASEVHNWLSSWGTEEESGAPGSGK
ncbi:CopG family ribbon-helix-helix protein [Methylophaga nitratireducenticrescens]|uniref:Transcriptional regulator n=1 Tax=Methylophaga nitratireducenticrescens TaxID=754476 RepID=I1XHA8_METNJ|nr:ribbon-helix-helix protein, CopG family [Methylophaga nitratireducenticrescens]AFI83777.1 transcriptional regulator [Methylophaga nitratireducenticrescens]AUZ83902.1 transcriptional regulator [Methylophaga nitratireducenticrescens]